MEINFVKIFGIVISAIFVNNFVLSRFLGLCPFIGISKKLDIALGMGLSMTFVVTMSSMITWPFYHFVLIPFNLEYLNIISFILIIACFVQLVEVFVEVVPLEDKVVPTVPAVRKEDRVFLW